MKNIIIIGILTIASLMSGCSKEEDKKVVLSATEIADLQTLREEEKLARDVYLFAYNKYSLDVFNNISNSEQKHMNKVLKLLNTYDIDDPAMANIGEFQSQALQDLYDDLTAQADVSLLEALKVGATIEDLDINDIENFMDKTNQQDILDVYAKLQCGSRNHMRKYYAQLIENDYTYAPQYISETELAEIISSSNEQCGR